MAGITRYDPLRNLMTLPRWFDEFEDRVFQKGLKIHETDKDIVVEAVIAGVPSKDVEIEVEDGVLTIKAQAKEEEKDKDEYKISSYRYYYTTALSGGQWDKTEAEVKDGIVKVLIPKTEAARPRKITIKTK